MSGRAPRLLRCYGTNRSIALFWTYGFPVLMAVVLGFAFQPHTPPPVPVALVFDVPEGTPIADGRRDPLQENPRLDVRLLTSTAADAALARGSVALTIRGWRAAPVLRGDPTRPESELARLIVEAELRGEAEAAALTAKSAALRDNPGYVALTAAEKWDGKLPQTMVPGSAVPFVTVPRGATQQ